MSKVSYGEIKLKPNAFLALTGLTIEEFELIVPEFEKAFQTHMSTWRLDGQARTKRSYTTDANCPLPTAEDRLLFVLSYVKGNPLQSNYGVLFGMVQGKTNLGCIPCYPSCAQRCATWAWHQPAVSKN